MNKDIIARTPPRSASHKKQRTPMSRSHLRTPNTQATTPKKRFDRAELSLDHNPAAVSLTTYKESPIRGRSYQKPAADVLTVLDKDSYPLRSFIHSNPSYKRVDDEVKTLRLDKKVNYQVVSEDKPLLV